MQKYFIFIREYYFIWGFIILGEDLRFNLNTNSQLNKPATNGFYTGGYTNAPSSFINSTFDTPNINMPGDFSSFSKSINKTINTGLNVNSDFMSAGIFNQDLTLGGNALGMPSLDADLYGSTFDMAKWTKQIQSIGLDVETSDKSEPRHLSARQERQARRASRHHETFDGTFDSALKKTLKFEGGYSNDKDDSGGPTNKGVTQKTYDSWCERNGKPKQSIKKITEEEVKDIYYNDYWLASGADKMSDPKMALALFDTAVLHGVSGAKKIYSQSDGDLSSFLAARKNRYDEIVAANPSQQKFYKGWMNRTGALA